MIIKLVLEKFWSFLSLMNVCILLFYLFPLSVIYSQDYDSQINNLVNQINLDSLTSYVRILSGEDSVYLNGSMELIRNRKYSRSDNALAADYLKQKMESFGLETIKQAFREKGENVIANQTGTINPNSIYIICAHYDAVTDYCADDNASGLAAVLETARILSQYELENTLIYAFWDEEEIGYYGSIYYVSDAKSNNLDIQGVINLDMIGFDSNGDGVIEIHVKNIANSVNIANLVFNTRSVYTLSLNPEILNPGEAWSDHSSFWKEGFSAITLIEDLENFNPKYHSIDDRINQFNLAYFHNATKLGFASICQLVGVKENEDLSLPVILSSFNAIPGDAEVVLNWITRSEINNLGFIIERSFVEEDGYEEIASFRTHPELQSQGDASKLKEYIYKDEQLQNSVTYFYKLINLDLTGKRYYHDLVQATPNSNFTKIDEESSIAQKIQLYQNYPNPFNSETVIGFEIFSNVNISTSLSIYNISGKLVRNFFYKHLEAGVYTLKWDGKDNLGKNQPSGIYLYRLKTGNLSQSKNLILLR